MPKRKKTDIDCNVIISAGINNGNCLRVIDRILKHHQNYISAEMLEGYKEVICRKKFAPYKNRLLKMMEIICARSMININNLKSDFSLPDAND